MVAIVIDEEWCKGCFLCVHYCPKKVFGKSEKRNGRGYTLPRLTTPEKCNSCKTCEYTCPELTITIEREREE